MRNLVNFEHSMHKFEPYYAKHRHLLAATAAAELSTEGKFRVVDAQKFGSDR